jgi:hypothetical protein
MPVNVLLEALTVTQDAIRDSLQNPILALQVPRLNERGQHEFFLDLRIGIGYPRRLSCHTYIYILDERCGFVKLLPGDSELTCLCMFSSRTVC